MKLDEMVKTVVDPDCPPDRIYVIGRLAAEQDDSLPDIVRKAFEDYRVLAVQVLASPPESHDAQHPDDPPKASERRT